MKLFFLHIPKAGGSTIHSLIERGYENRTLTLHPLSVDPKGDTPARYLQAVEDRFNAIKPEELARVKIIKGHFYYGLHRKLDETSKYFTFLRDPVERVISSYYFIRYRPHAYSEIAKTISLKDFVAQGYFINNQQTKMLYGKDWEGRSDEELLKGAKDNLLKDFVFVGITEEFDKSLILLKLATKMPLGIYRQQNITRDKPNVSEVDSETIELIRSVNRADIEIYNYTKKIFNEKWKKNSPFAELLLLGYKLKNLLGRKLFKIDYKEGF